MQARTIRTLSTLSTLSAVATVTALPALAQQAENDAPDSVDRITVTGARAPIAVDRIGSATTIITRDDIERRQARYLSDVLRSVPGFAVSVGGGVGSQTQTRVRGGEANHILVLIDGVRVNDASSGDEFRWEHIATGNVERVEIVRGPQSALWGSDAIGAVINIITRSGSAAERFDGYAEGGANGTRNAAATASGTTESWSLSGSVESLDTDGTNISRSGTEDDGASLDTGSFSARYERPDGFALDATLRATDASSDYDAVDFIGTGLPTDGDYVTDSDSVLGRAEARIGSHDGSVLWSVWTDYVEYNHFNTVDGLADSSTASERVSFGVQTDIGVGANELSLALNREDTDFAQRGAVVFGDPNQDQSLTTTSAIFEYRHLANDRFSWIVSSRYDRHDAFDDALTGKVSLSYRINDLIRVRGNVGTAQKTPTFIERFGFFPSQFVGNPDLKPESSVAYDLGLDRQSRGGNVSFGASLYWQEFDDEIDGFVFDADSLQFTAANRPGTSERLGLELTADWRINEAIGFGASYTFTDATEETDSGATERELRRPRHAGTLSLDVTPPAGKIDLAFIAEYGGRRNDVFFPPFPEPSRRVSLSDYWLIDVSVQYRVTPTLAVIARGTNLLDENYEQVYGYRTLGRAAYVGVRADLGR